MGDTDKKYVPEGVFLVCNQGGAPTQLICDPHPITLYGVRYADENDNKPQLNIPSFGSCKTMGKCEPPLLLKWTKLKEDVRLHGARPLLEDSECVCPIGSGVITIFFDEYDAAEAAESNNESGFVKEDISTQILGSLGSGIFGMISPKLRDGVGRGLKKGMEGTWNFVTHDVWQGETWVGMGKMALIASAYSSPSAGLTADATLGAFDSLMGTDLRQTRDAIVSGVKKAGGHALENIKRGNVGEVGEDIGQLEYIVVEAAAGSKGAGLAVKGVKAGAEMLVGAERLAQIAARSERALELLKTGVSGVVKVGRKERTLRELVEEAHGLLDEFAQGRKTTAIGRDAEGNLFISSSDKTVPKVQREWAEKNGIKVVNGEGHAEETIMKGAEKVEHIDASRGVCLDCEEMMTSRNVKTDTKMTGKKSKKRR